MSGQKFADTAMNYHRRVPPGKLAVVPTKPLATQRDLSLAYSPGVADACHGVSPDYARRVIRMHATAIGAMLLGAAMPIHVVTPSITARGLLNMTALAVVDAQAGERHKTEGEEDS